MAHYALLDENNTVVQVITGQDESNTEYDWEEFYSLETGFVCKRTSYNTYGGVHLFNGTPYRKNYAGIGFTYNSQLDAFIPPKPFSSWILDERTCQWIAPIPIPQDDKVYYWDESILSWVEDPTSSY